MAEAIEYRAMDRKLWGVDIVDELDELDLLDL